MECKYINDNEAIRVANGVYSVVSISNINTGVKGNRANKHVLHNKKNNNSKGTFSNILKAIMSR